MSLRKRYMLKNGKRACAMGFLDNLKAVWRLTVLTFDNHETAQRFSNRIMPLTDKQSYPQKVRGTPKWSVTYYPNSAKAARQILAIYREMKAQDKPEVDKATAPVKAKQTGRELKKPLYLIPRLLGQRRPPFPIENLDANHPAWQWWYPNSPDQHGAAGRLGKVGVDKLVTVQHYVSPKNVDKVRSYSKVPITVIIHNGKPVLTDGNHRATRAWLDGQKRIPAEFYMMSPDGKFVPYKGDIRKFL